MIATSDAEHLIRSIQDRLKALQADASRAFDMPIEAELKIGARPLSITVRPADVLSHRPWIFADGSTIDECIQRARVQFEKTLRERDEQQRLNDMTLGIVEAA
jgi:hypothetical protein